MKRHALTGIAALFATSALAADIPKRVQNAHEQRPNIVLIMADDLSHRNLGCYGAVNFETPNLDKLAASGMRFDHCFSMPLCTPSRVALMTGQHNGRNFLRASTLEADQRTFGDVAKEAGYATCVVGKWKLTGKSKESTPERFGFDEQAKKQGVTVDSLLSDGMHPNDDGHRIEADLLRERILALAKTHGLAITEGPLWKASGEFVTIHPLCTDITHDSPNPTVLGCGLTRMKDGAVMTVYSTPTGYYSKPGTTWIAGRVTKDGGKTWSPERVIARHPDCQPSHPSVLTMHDGVIHVFYLGFKQWKWKGVNPTDEAQSDMWTTRSSDNGATWSEPQMIFKGYTGASNGAIETRDGHLIVPYSHYVNDPGRLVSQTSVSTNGGKTWSLSNDIDIGGAGDHEGALEPCVIELKDGRVWMLIRTSRGFFWESFSTDGGKTWSEAKATNIDTTSAPGHLTRLAAGRIALVWNRAQKKRTELHLALSADEGQTWAPSLNVARGTPGGATYPFVVEINPGELWIGYHNVPKGWNFPRARHLRISLVSFNDTAKR